ncbi:MULTISPECIES: hypothetical protein [Plantibacter]|nr:hypothetical protein [Plantibacter sp. lyk4-40-MEA-4]
MTGAGRTGIGTADDDEEAEARSDLLTAAHLTANDREREVLLRKVAALPQ